MCIDAVFDELGDRLQRIVLRERDDADRVPVIADLELAAVSDLPLPRGVRLRSAYDATSIGVSRHGHILFSHDVILAYDDAAVI